MCFASILILLPYRSDSQTRRDFGGNQPVPEEDNDDYADDLDSNVVLEDDGNDSFTTDYAPDDNEPANDNRDDALQNQTSADDNEQKPTADNEDNDTGLQPKAASSGVNKDMDFAIDEDNDDDDEEDNDGINIDSGFLKDSAGKEVKLPDTISAATPAAVPRTAAANASSAPTIVFYFCLLGGVNADGPVNLVDILNTGLSQLTTPAATVISALPAALTAGETSAAYTSSGLTACGTGYTLLTPYGHSYLPGSCYDYSFTTSRWNDTGARLASYRKGASLSRVGKYLVAAGGRRGRRSLSSIELYDLRRPERGWRRMGRMAMPVAVAEHCTVTMRTAATNAGDKGRHEVIVTGGRGRDNRAMKLDVGMNK